MMGNRKCETCKYAANPAFEDLVCTNDESEYLTDYVDKKHWCEEYEPREDLEDEDY